MYLLTSGAITAALLGVDLVRLVRSGRLPPDDVRYAALAAAALLGAVGLSSRQTRQTLELARRLEHARLVGSRDRTLVAVPTPAPSG